MKMRTTARVALWVVGMAACLQACQSIPCKSKGDQSFPQYLRLFVRLHYRSKKQWKGPVYGRFWIHRDHCIKFSFSTPWGFELACGVATQGQVTLVSHAQKWYIQGDYKALEKLFPGPWSYQRIQKLLLGYHAQPLDAHSQSLISDRRAWACTWKVRASSNHIKRFVAQSPKGHFQVDYYYTSKRSCRLLSFRKAVAQFKYGVLKKDCMTMQWVPTRWCKAKPTKCPFLTVPSHYNEYGGV